MDWLAQFFDRLFVWVPRCLIIRSTHGGVKWRTNLVDDEAEPAIVELKPGLHWFWPLTSDIETIVTARRPVDVPTMSLLTSDGKSVIVSASVVFRINNVTLALGERNWDVDSTLVDITQNVIFDAVRSRQFANLLAEPGQLKEEITENSKSELKKFGILVERVLLKDFDTSRTYRVLGDANFIGSDEVDE